jgi:hypothetical protein
MIFQCVVWQRSVVRYAALYLFLAAFAIFLTSMAKAASNACSAMDANGPEWFASELDKVEATFRQGAALDAYNQLVSATNSVPRSVDVSMSGRCVGNALWSRAYQLRLSIAKMLGQEEEKKGQSTNPQAALEWFVQSGELEGASRVIPKLANTASGTSSVISRLRTKLASFDQVREHGFVLLPEEQAAATFWQTKLDDTISYARTKGGETLREEATLLTRDATDQELQIEQLEQDQRTLVAAMFGDDELAVQNEAMRDINRAAASQSMLSNARDWFAAIDDTEAAPARDRALARGNALMSKAEDNSVGLETRDLLYGAAADYFRLAKSSDRREAAERSQLAIEPALEAERAKRAARLEQRSEELADSARKARKDMEKTEAEKQSFKDEADALEAELGF